MKELEEIKFNLTHEMSLKLIEFNKTKKELENIKELYNLDKNETLLLDITKLEKKLKKIRKDFIISFRNNNKKEILEYLEYQKKDQN